MSKDSIDVNKIKFRKKWKIDPSTKIETPKKEYNRADFKRELKEELEELEDETQDNSGY